MEFDLHDDRNYIDIQMMIIQHRTECIWGRLEMPL